MGDGCLEPADGGLSRLGHDFVGEMNRLRMLLDLSHAAAPGCRFIMASDTHEYAWQCLSNLTTLPGLWRNCYLPAGYRIDIPTRFPTVFERYKKSEGCSIAYLLFERTALAAPRRAPYQARRVPEAPVVPIRNSPVISD